VVVLTLAYKIAADTGQDLAVGLFTLGGATLAPYLWASAMRFRLSNTRWRGLRLQFTAGWREVYGASWPVFAMAAVVLAMVFSLQALEPEAVEGTKPSLMTGPMWAVVAIGMVLLVLCFIRLEYHYRRLLVLRTRVGGESGRWKPVYMDFVGIWAKTVGVFLAVVLGVGAIGGLLLGGAVAAAAGEARGMGFVLALLFGMVLAAFLLVLASAPARAYREARLFQLTWNQVGLSSVARTKCSLRTGAFVKLRLKNMLLTLLTLGFYRPFARVSEYQMKFESVTLYVKGDLAQLAGEMVRQQEAGLGDALADAAGLDLIG
jgi:uncharacterized membrane protein YjgN (DUF898 family)